MSVQYGIWFTSTDINTSLDFKKATCTKLRRFTVDAMHYRKQNSFLNAYTKSIKNFSDSVEKLKNMRYTVFTNLITIKELPIHTHKHTLTPAVFSHLKALLRASFAMACRTAVALRWISFHVAKNTDLEDLSVELPEVTGGEVWYIQ